MSNRSPGFSDQSDEAFSYEMDDAETVTEAVLTAVATVTGDTLVPVGDDADSSPGLPPLYTAVDPDSLESLFHPTRSGGRTPGQVQFRYANCVVTVEGNGLIRIRPETDESF